jgi:Fe-S-cluster-containing dehydrogenase component
MKKQTRRNFFKVLGTGATLMAGTASAAASTKHHANNDELAMLYDANKCVGCKACMVACKRVNGDSGNLAFEQAEFDHDKIWDAPEDLSGDTRTIIKVCKQDNQWSYIKHSCMHCQKPSCVSVCPVSAMRKDKVTGIVDYDKNTCLGCRYCQIACAFNIPKFQWDKTVPQIVKCDFCRNTNLKEKGIPACVEFCPTGAILFGKRGSLLQEARNRLAQDPEKYVQHIYGEHEVGGTNFMYIAGMPFQQLGVPNLPSNPPAEFAEKIQHTIYKGFIAPIALYGALGFVALKNMKRRAHKQGTSGQESGLKRELESSAGWQPAIQPTGSLLRYNPEVRIPEQPQQEKDK